MATKGLMFNDAVESIRQGSTVQDATRQLLASMTTSEKLSILTGPRGFWPGLTRLMTGAGYKEPWSMGAVPRLGIPGVLFADGPRGVVLGENTCFPIAMARGATWDTALEERVGKVMATEARARGVNVSGSVCINLPRHPAWGRIQETYGEDPILLGEFGVALTKSLQANGVIACVKHYALNSMENMRFYVDVTVDDAPLHEVYLAHFEMVVREAPSMCVMSAYNSFNGEWCGQNDVLLNQILRKRWGFKHFVIADWVFGLRDSVKSLKNGLDLEAPFLQVRTGLQRELDRGDISMDDVEQSASRILSAQLEIYTTRKGPEPDETVILCQEHRDLAREVARKSMVLLKNERGRHGDHTTQPLLPVDPTQLKRCAVIGRLADAENTGDWGSSYVKTSSVITPYQGIKAAMAVHGGSVTLVENDDAGKAATAAKAADFAVVVVGYSAIDEGENLASSNPLKLVPFPTLTELVRDVPQVLWQQAKERLGFGYAGQGPSVAGKAGGDRKSLRLSAGNIKLIRAVRAANPRTIVAIIASGAVLTSEWIDEVDAVLMSWYSGCEGGNALADVIFGAADASGRLPFSIPRNEKDLPFFDAKATKITYDRWFGQRLLDRKGVTAQFPLGFGCSYTQFSVGKFDVQQDGNYLKVQLEVTNVGLRAGRYVAQVYGVPTEAGKEFPARLLLGFKPVDLLAKESRTVEVVARIRPLQRWDNGVFVLASRETTIEVGGFSGDCAASKTITLSDAS